MKIDRIIVEPGHGACNEEGKFDFGQRIDHLTEVECIQSIAQALEEELDLARVRFEILPTRHMPGVRPSARPARVPPNSLLVSIHTGWHSKPKAENSSLVFFSDDFSKTLAEALQGPLARWGGVSHPKHGSTQLRASMAPMLTIPDVCAVQIEPFALNGPNAICYAQRLPQLGKLLGQVLSEFVSVSHPRAFIRPTLTATR